MSLDEFHNWANMYLSQLSQPMGNYMPFALHNEFRELFNWFEKHYHSCKYFNGFSIAKPPRDRRHEDIIIRCSCGSNQFIPRDLWCVRLQNTDLEDIIEDMNYKCQDRANFNMEERMNYYIDTEIKKRKFMEEYDARFERKKIQEKNGLNPILDLEV